MNDQSTADGCANYAQPSASQGHPEHLEDAEVPSDIKRLFSRLNNALKGERISAEAHIRPMEKNCPQCYAFRKTTEGLIKQLQLRFEEVIIQRDGARAALRKTMARMPDLIVDPDNADR